MSSSQDFERPPVGLPEILPSALKSPLNGAGVYQDDIPRSAYARRQAGHFLKTRGMLITSPAQLGDLVGLANIPSWQPMQFVPRGIGAARR